MSKFSSNKDQVTRILRTVDLTITPEQAEQKIIRFKELCAKYNIQPQPIVKDEGTPNMLSDIAAKFKIPPPLKLNDAQEIQYKLNSPGILDPLGTSGNPLDHYPPISTSWVVPLWYPNGYDKELESGSGSKDFQQQKIDKPVRFDEALLSLEAVEAWANNQKGGFTDFCKKLDIHGIPPLIYLANLNSNSQALKDAKDMIEEAAPHFVAYITAEHQGIPVWKEYYADDYSHQPARENNITKGQVFVKEVQEPLKELFGIDISSSLPKDIDSVSLTGEGSSLEHSDSSDVGASAAAGG